MLVTVSAIALAGVAQAQGPGEHDTPPEPEQRQETVTVYGTSNPIPVFDYPGQVSVITRDEIELRTPSAVSDLLRDVPGMAFPAGRGARVKCRAFAGLLARMS